MPLCQLQHTAFLSSNSGMAGCMVGWRCVIVLGSQPQPGHGGLLLWVWTPHFNPSSLWGGMLIRTHLWCSVLSCKWWKGKYLARQLYITAKTYGKTLNLTRLELCPHCKSIQYWWPARIPLPITARCVQAHISYSWQRIMYNNRKSFFKCFTTKY